VSEFGAGVQLEYRTASPVGAWESLGPGAKFQGAAVRLGGLEENTRYDARVTAGNTDGLSAPALLSAAAVTPTNPPEPPSAVREAAHTETSVSLTWDPPTAPAATAYRVLLSECRKSLWQQVGRFRPLLSPRPHRPLLFCFAPCSPRCRR
jgi:hypothetical protein